jgi:hypothetical protein
MKLVAVAEVDLAMMYSAQAPAVESCAADHGSIDVVLFLAAEAPEAPVAAMTTVAAARRSLGREGYAAQRHCGREGQDCVAQYGRFPGVVVGLYTPSTRARRVHAHKGDLAP